MFNLSDSSMTLNSTSFQNISLFSSGLFYVVSDNYDNITIVIVECEFLQIKQSFHIIFISGVSELKIVNCYFAFNDAGFIF